MTKRTWGRISEAIRYFFVSLIATISATDVIATHHVKWWTLGLSIGIIALKSADMAIGVPTAPRRPKPEASNP